MEQDYTEDLGDATTQNTEGSSEPLLARPEKMRETRRYQVLLPFGEGAMGQVFLAKDRYLLRKVALKKLLPHIAQNPAALGRFLREAQITAQLDHPSVVPVYTLEEAWDQTPAYAMKLVRGDTLKEQIQRVKAQPNPNQLRPLLEQFLKVCDTLAYAHSKGVIHRDLKPANLMSGDFGAVYVMDWGIARKMSEQDALSEEAVELSYPDDISQDETQAGHILGTPRYMSPEQAAGKNEALDGRSDQLALGLILYEIVTLRQAYQAATMGALLKTVLKAEKQPMQSPYPQQPVPPELMAIIDKATARKAIHRYPDVGAMAQDIRRYLRGEAVQAKPDTPYQATVRWIGKHQGWALLLLFVLLTTGAMGLGTNLERNRREMETARAQSQKLGAFLQAVAEQTQTINRQFSRYEHILQRLSTSSTLLLQQGRPDPETLYTDREVLQGKTPPDWIYAYPYNSWLSPSWPIWHGPRSAQQQLLSGLRPLLPSLFSTSQTGLKTSELNHHLRDQGLPISWLFVALEQGALMTYPGKAGLATTYRLQDQPWYQQARQATGIHWGQPYADSRGQGLVLAATQRLENVQGQLLGVAGLEISFQYLVDALLTLPQVPEVVESFLIDSQGRMQVRSSARSRMQGLRFGEAAGSSAVLELPLFPQAGVIQAMHKQPSGYRRYQAEGRQMLAAWYQIPALQGYYLVTLDAGRYFSATGAAGEQPSPAPSAE
jgi:serine/threonine protein kinase